MLINVPFTLVPLCSKGNALFIFLQRKQWFFDYLLHKLWRKCQIFNLQWAPPPWVGSRGHMVHTLASGWILKPPGHTICVRSTVVQTSRNCASFELQLHDSNPMFFCKNHFQHPNVLFYHGSDFTFGRFTPQASPAFVAVLAKTCGGHQKFKNNQKHLKPRHTGSLWYLVYTKNMKLEKSQIFHRYPIKKCQSGRNK